MAARFAAEPTTSINPTITPPPTSAMTAIASITNTTSTYLNLSSSRELVLVPLRYVYKAERFLFRTIPRQVAQSLYLDRLFQNAAEAAGGTDIPVGAAIAMADPIAEGAAGGIRDTWSEALHEAFGFHNVRSFGGMLSYTTSRWFLTCSAMTFVLNRVGAYAASRQRIYLTWDKRFAIRIVPILLLLSQTHSLLQGIRCQTSSDWSLHRYGQPGKLSSLDWTTNGGPLYEMSSTILFWEDDSAACSAIQMSRPTSNSTAPYGSFSLLWPTFLRLCAAHFVETLSCSLQQNTVRTENGLSIFEHSLAFAEAEAMVGHSLGLGIFGSPKPGSSAANRTAEVARDASIDTTIGSRPFILDKVNVPVEVLLIALISTCNSLTSNVIAVFNKQSKWRLLNTAWWGVCFMTAFVWGFFNSSISHGDISSGFLRFPTVCIVGFLPHISIIAGMLVCGWIYLVALTLTALSLETNPAIRQPRTFLERFQIARENLQATIHVKGLEIRWNEDFYTMLLRIGFSVLSAASEAVFLNEGRAVEVRRYTWLEEERFDELETAKGSKESSAAYYHIREEFGLPPDARGPFQSGYGKEQKIEDTKTKPGRKDVQINPGPDGVGAMQRTLRFWLLFVYFKGIFLLIMGWIAFGFGSTLDYVGITFRPRWLRKLIGKSTKQATADEARNRALRQHDYTLEFWLRGDEGELTTPRTERYDIEPEMRRRLLLEHEGKADKVEKKLDDKLYRWWKNGGWWGTEDFSGEYQLSSEDNEDTTSVISMSTSASVASTTDDERDWDDLSSGQITPTQAVFTRESTPFPESDLTPLDADTLSRLLNPRDAAERSEARILSSHLSAPDRHIVTRSQYRRQVERDRCQILLSGRLLPPADLSSTKPTPDQESEILERLILDRRQPHRSHNHDEQQSGLLCVVCQASPRSIIAWPCRCLCICEDCRVSLAMNNFGSCVTCRRDVGGFVRMWVP